jgi:hypothetical protein
MNLKVTRVIYSVFILIFLAITAFLIFYANGYTYDFTKKKIEKTGVLFIKSYPRNAEIYLNGKLQTNTTPTLINRLLPNDYQVTIKKNGYFDWKKTLTVYPKDTTFIEDITLFKNEFKYDKLLTGNFTKLLLSPSNDKVLLLEKNANRFSLWLYTFFTKASQSIYSNDKVKNFELVSWCPTGEKIIAKEDKNYYSINTENGHAISLSDFSKKAFDEVKCDYFNDNLVYAKTSDKIFKIDLLSKKIEIIINEPIIGFLPWQTKLLYITKNKDQYLLKSYFNQKAEEVLILPQATNYKFYPSANQEIALVNQDNQTAYLLNLENKNPFLGQLKNADQIEWHDHNLIYWNKNELWVYYPKDNSSILLERSSSPIQNAFWHSGIVYVFSQIDNRLKVYEIDSRDKRNVLDLMTLSEKTQNNIFVNKKGDYLFLITDKDNQPGFYSVQIQ